MGLIDNERKSIAISQIFAIVILSTFITNCTSKKQVLQETIFNTGVDPENVITIPHGFDENVFCRPNVVQRCNAVATIAALDSKNYHRKGLRLFVEAARFLPDIPFFLRGPEWNGWEIKKHIATKSNYNRWTIWP